MLFVLPEARASGEIRPSRASRRFAKPSSGTIDLRGGTIVTIQAVSRKCPIGHALDIQPSGISGDSRSWEDSSYGPSEQVPR